jgi:RNA polymerase sigma-70 factor (ECF subfamily)
MSQDLVLRAQAGDRDAYESLARAAAQRLHLVALRILRDADAAEDAVQATLLAMWRDLPSLRDPDRFDAWTYRMVVRACHNVGRRERRMRVEVVDISDDVRARDDQFADVVVRDELARAFERLSLDHRTVVVLHHLVGLPIAEIAEILDIPYGTVGSRLHHAMRAMRASLEASERTPVRGGMTA